MLGKSRGVPEAALNARTGCGWVAGGFFNNQSWGVLRQNARARAAVRLQCCGQGLFTLCWRGGPQKMKIQRGSLEM